MHIHKRQARSADECKRVTREPCRDQGKGNSREQGHRVAPVKNLIGRYRAGDECDYRNEIGPRRGQHQPARIDAYADKPIGRNFTIAGHRHASIWPAKQPAEQRSAATGSPTASAAAVGIPEFQPSLAVCVTPDHGRLPDQACMPDVARPPHSRCRSIGVCSRLRCRPISRTVGAGTSPTTVTRLPSMLPV